jgi:hypothetical protein
VNHIETTDDDVKMIKLLRKVEAAARNVVVSAVASNGSKAPPLDWEALAELVAALNEVENEA